MSTKGTTCTFVCFPLLISWCGDLAHLTSSTDARRLRCQDFNARLLKNLRKWAEMHQQETTYWVNNPLQGLMSVTEAAAMRRSSVCISLVYQLPLNLFHLSRCRLTFPLTLFVHGCMPSQPSPALSRNRLPVRNTDSWPTAPLTFLRSTSFQFPGNVLQMTVSCGTFKAAQQPLWQPILSNKVFPSLSSKDMLTKNLKGVRKFSLLSSSFKDGII